LFTRIVVGTDGSETATEAVRQAVELAQATGASLQVVSAYEPAAPRPEATSEQRDAPNDVQTGAGPRENLNFAIDSATGMAKNAGVEATPHAREGDPADAIIDVAESTNADLIVVGTRG